MVVNRKRHSQDVTGANRLLSTGLGGRLSRDISVLLEKVVFGLHIYPRTDSPVLRRNLNSQLLKTPQVRFRYSDNNQHYGR